MIGRYMRVGDLGSLGVGVRSDIVSLRGVEMIGLELGG